jgi:hypothetical protein
VKFSILSPKAIVCLFFGTIVTLQASPQQREKQPEPAKQEKAAPAQQPQHAQQPRPQAQPQQQRAEQPKPQAQPQQRAEQPKPQAQPQQQRAQQPKPQVQPQQRAEQPKPQSQPQQQQRAQQPKQQAQPQQRAQAQGGQPAQQRNSGVQSARNYAPPQRSTQQAQAWQQKSGWRQSGGWQGGATFQADRASNWGSEHRTWGQRGGYGGYYIPQASFGLYFGEGHLFRIGSQPFIVGGYPRFQYGGYTFMMVDPWPGDWAPNWFDADQLYVGYDNGYYLYDQMHPGEAVALAVVM